MDNDDFLNKVLSMSKGQRFIYSLIYYDKKDFFKSDLESYFGYNIPQQDLRRIMTFLIDMKVLIIVGKDRKDYKYKTDKTSLKKLIRNSPLFKDNGKFIEETKGVYIY